MSATIITPKPGSPVGVHIPDHPWRERTEREYYTDKGGDRFSNGDKIVTGGEMFIKYTGHMLTFDAVSGEQIKGPKTSWWEHVPEPKSLQGAKHLD